MKQLFIILLLGALLSVNAQKDYYSHSYGFEQLIDNYYAHPVDSSKIILSKKLKELSISEISDNFNLINHLYEHLNDKNDSTSILFLYTLRSWALGQYSSRNFEVSNLAFEKYFRLNKKLLPNPSYCYEYSKYAYSYYLQGQFDKFLELSHQGLKTCQDSQTPDINKCEFYINLGKYYNKLQQTDSSAKYADLALLHYEKSAIKNPHLASRIYSLKSLTELISNNYKLAKIYIDESINQLLSSDYSEIQLASLYLKKAQVFLFSNQQNKAIETHQLVISIYQAHDASPGKLSNSYYNIALSYYLLEDYQSCLNYLQKSLELNGSISNYKVHRFLANTYFAMNDIESAEKKYLEVLDYQEKQKNKNIFQIGLTKFHLGQLLLEKTKRHNEGEKYLEESIQLYYQHFRGRDQEIITLLNILGTHYINKGEIERGLDTLQSSLMCAAPKFKFKSNYENPEYEILENNNFSNNTLAWKAFGLFKKYEKTQAIDDLIASQKTYEFYIHCANENRKLFDNTSSIVTSSQVHHVFNEAINISYLLFTKTKEEQYKDDIFKFIEGKKAFTLFQSLKILEQKKLLNIPTKLLDKEKDLKYQLSLLEDKINANKRLKQFDSISEKLEEDKQNYTRSLDSLQVIFKSKYSSFYNLKYGFKVLDAKEMMNKIDSDKTFVNYSISDSLLHILVFTNEKKSLMTQKIDSSFFSDIEQLVQLLKEVNTDNAYKEFQQFSKSSYRLYQKLIEPVKDQFKGKELIFIPDDELNYISFDALISDVSGIDRPDFRQLHYLIKDYSINVANSMQIYFNMKQRQKNPNNLVLAFAPYYPLFPNKDSLPPEYQDLRPLDYAKWEVQAISKIMNTQSFIGNQATKDTFAFSAKNAGILHLSMHTIINDEKPLFSKFLFTHQSGEKSSMLHTYELLGLDLNAELAVLSGCSTGDGKLQKGEGVMSLSSGFQYAGVPSIVMSLWEVNDRFGSLVIQKFYQNLADGKNKKEALYEAKLNVLNQGNALYAHPYYWAGLTLMGNESKIDFINRYQWDKIVIVLTPFLFIIIVLFQTRKKWLFKKT